MYKALDNKLNNNQHTFVSNYYIVLLRISGLTTRQAEVLILLGKGLSNKSLANTLQVSENTIKVHISAIFKVLHVNNRTEAVLSMQNILAKDDVA